MDSWNLRVVSLLAYTDPNKPYIFYTDAYDIACGGALVQSCEILIKWKESMYSDTLSLETY